VEQRLGPVPFPLAMDEAAAREYAALQLPLPSARWKPEADDARLPLVEAVLAEEGLTLRDVQVRGVRELFFSRGERAARIEVMNASAEWADDERHPGCLRLTLRFDLGRGSYATLVVKGVT
jgi:tRNA pseudouridine13 synthase